MKNILAATALALCAAAPAFAADQDFKLHNRTGYEIKEVYLSPPKEKSWGNDILGTGTLGDDQSANVSFHSGTTACKWEMKVVFSDGESAEWDAFDLCETNKISLFYKNSQTSAVAE